MKTNWKRLFVFKGSLIVSWHKIDLFNDEFGNSFAWNTSRSRKTKKNMVVVETSIMTISNPQKNACEDCLDAFILNCQKSSVSTRQTNSSKTCIDWLYSNSAKTVKVPYLLIADHTTKITYLKETENE